MENRGTTVRFPPGTGPIRCIMSKCTHASPLPSGGGESLRGFRQGTFMRTTSRGAGRFLLVGVLVAAVGGATWVLAAEPEKNGKGAKAEKAKPPRTYAFAMSKKPWRQVIVWLADQLDVPFVGSIIPDDTFNFIPPQ